MGTGVAALLAGLAVAVAVLGYHIFNVHRLRRWLLRPKRNAIPNSFGLWERVFTELHRHEREYARERRRLVHLVVGAAQAGRALPDAVVMLDRNNRVEWCNGSAEVTPTASRPCARPTSTTRWPSSASSTALSTGVPARTGGCRTAMASV